MSRFNIDGEKSARKMLADAVSSLGTVQRKMQAIIVWGVSHAEKHGDHTFLCDVYRSVFAKNKRMAAQIQLYLFDALNLEKTLEKVEGVDTVKFVRVLGEDGKKLPLIRDREVLEKNWFEYKQAPKNTEYDVEALEKYLESKIKSAKSTEGAVAYCQQLLDNIKADRVAMMAEAA